MKVLIIGTAYPLRGGIAHFNALLASHLGTHHSVETITFSRQYPSIFFPGKTQEEVGSDVGTMAAPRMVDSINPINWIQVGREVRRRKPDLLIFKYWMPFFGPCFGTIARIAKKNGHTKVLFICDNVIPHERRAGDILLTKYAFSSADFFIVQSVAVENDLRNFLPDAVYRKVPHPVYENFGESIPKETARKHLNVTNRKVILFFGYIRAYKGLRVLLHAMKKLSERGHGDILLLIVGECYDDEAKYRVLAKELHVESQVRFVSDYIPNERVKFYFSAADVVVLPYLSATQSGIAQIAYNFTKPVIVTDVGGLAEVVQDNRTGFVIPPNDPDQLADAVDRFYKEEKEQEFTLNVEKEKRKYSWENFVAAIEDLVGGSDHK